MFRFLQTTLLLWLGLGLSSLVMAQNAPMQPTSGPITDEELKTFVTASQEIQAINQNLQEQMVTEIQAGGMELTRFQEIQKEMQAAGATGEKPEMSEEEQATYQQIMQKLQAIQMKAQEQMMQDMQASGISMQRYREIGMALQSDQELQQRVEEIQKEMMEE